MPKGCIEQNIKIDGNDNMNIQIVIFVLAISPLFSSAMKEDEGPEQKTFREKYVQVGIDPATFEPIYQKRTEYTPRHYSWQAEEEHLSYKAKL